MAAYGNVQTKYLVEQVDQMTQFLDVVRESFANDKEKAEYESTRRVLLLLRLAMREELARRGVISL